MLGGVALLVVRNEKNAGQGRTRTGVSSNKGKCATGLKTTKNCVVVFVFLNLAVFRSLAFSMHWLRKQTRSARCWLVVFRQIVW